MLDVLIFSMCITKTSNNFEVIGGIGITPIYFISLTLFN